MDDLNAGRPLGQLEREADLVQIPDASGNSFLADQPPIVHLGDIQLPDLHDGRIGVLEKDLEDDPADPRSVRLFARLSGPHAVESRVIKIEKKSRSFRLLDFGDEEAGIGSQVLGLQGLLESGDKRVRRLACRTRGR